jgi:hypothetical protein
MEKSERLWLLSYFDQKLNERRFYMNRTGFPSEDRALQEYERIMNHKKHMEAKGVFTTDLSFRSKYALEVFENGKIKLLRTLD